MIERAKRIQWDEINNQAIGNSTVWCFHAKTSDFKVVDIIDLSSTWISFLLNPEEKIEIIEDIHHIKTWDELKLNFWINWEVIDTKWTVMNVLENWNEPMLRCWTEFDWLSEESRSDIDNIIKSRSNNI